MDTYTTLVLGTPADYFKVKKPKKKSKKKHGNKK